MPQKEGASEEPQRQVIGDPEMIHSADGIAHKMQFELGEKNGVAIVVAVETEDSPALKVGGHEISPLITRKVYLEIVETPSDPDAIQAAIESVRAQICAPLPEIDD